MLWLRSKESRHWVVSPEEAGASPVSHLRESAGVGEPGLTVNQVFTLSGFESHLSHLE